MIRIRTGAAWRHDPELRAALSRAAGRARAAAARAVADALAIEIDGVDIAAGRAEGALLPSLEGLLRAIARVVGGAGHATVAFPEGEVELLIRRVGSAALLTVVSVGRPSQVLARDVEVDVEALAAAALEASASFFRELAELLPDAASAEARGLRAAEHDLRRAEPVAVPAGGAPASARTVRGGTPATVACAVELGDEDGLLLAYEGGRPDLGSLLSHGHVVLRVQGADLARLEGVPFLLLRDLGAAATRIVAAARRGEARVEVPLARSPRGGRTALSIDVAAGRVSVAAASAACAPLDLARALSEAAVGFARLARARNPRQAENAHLSELEAAAAERIAEIDELTGGDLSCAMGASARAPTPARPSQRPLGPGRLRRLAFQRTFGIDVGAPTGDGLHARGALVVACGAGALAAIARSEGRVLWRADGVHFASALPGAVLAARDGRLTAHAPRSGRVLWARPLPGARPTSAVALARGPYVLVEPSALTGIDPGSGRTLWRFAPPGATRLSAAAFGGVVAAASDTGFAYGLDAAGRVTWRVRIPGPALGPPSPALGACVVLAELDGGAALLALDPASGARRWEAPLDLVPTGAPVAWGRRVAIPGTLAGDAAVAVVERGGAPAWTVAPPLAGATSAVAAGALLVVRDRAGALLALGRDGVARWTRPAPAHPPASSATPAVARGTLLVAGDAVAALDARTGELVGAIPTLAQARVVADAALRVVAMDADGVVTGHRLATHLSVI